MQDEKRDVEKLNVWVTKHQKQFLKARAGIESTSISSVVRQCVDLYENQETLNTNIDKICAIIDRQIDISFRKNLDRIIKLVVKSVISSESANHNSAELLASIKKMDINEVKDTAYHYATNYLQRKTGGIVSE